ncbi:MAG TPA: FHA domain-containing protein, partial [Acidimicrobiales bacterium]|nr:FHA domain-containing protein [Acidimicrobiales bacterium]
YAALVKPLQWLVVAVIFLFFLRVARAVTVQARAPRDTPSPSAARRRNRRFALEFIEPDARFGERVELPTQLDIGRSPTAGLVLDDAYVSSRHASVEYDHDGLVLSDLGSTNGTYVNEKPIDHPTRLKRGDVVQIGSFVFEVVR